MHLPPSRSQQERIRRDLLARDPRLEEVFAAVPIREERPAIASALPDVVPEEFVEDVERGLRRFGHGVTIGAR